jgi:demethylspheroidene O-methyltransferase
MVADGPLAEADLVERLALPAEGAQRLLTAAAALKLVERRSGGRWGLGVVGGPLLASPGLAQMVEHNALLYDELRDPVAHLRRAPGEGSALAEYWPYVDGPRRASLGAADVSGYSALMTATLPPLADELLDAVPLAGRRALLDVGGGEGAFVLAAARRHPHLACTLFDLPPVAARGRRRLAEAGLADRVRAVGGDFEREPLPPGADVATLVRVCLDHDDATVSGLLRRIREALVPGGTVVVAEPLAGVPGAEAVGDVYFAYYLRAMGRGRARRADELCALLQGAGFRRVRVRPTRYPVVAGVITGEA